MKKKPLFGHVSEHSTHWLGLSTNIRIFGGYLDVFEIYRNFRGFFGLTLCFPCYFPGTILCSIPEQVSSAISHSKMYSISLRGLKQHFFITADFDCIDVPESTSSVPSNAIRKLAVSWRYFENYAESLRGPGPIIGLHATSSFSKIQNLRATKVVILIRHNKG